MMIMKMATILINLSTRSNHGDDDSAHSNEIDRHSLFFILGSNYCNGH